jgi:hypothetical protein
MFGGGVTWLLSVTVPVALRLIYKHHLLWKTWWVKNPRFITDGSCFVHTFSSESLCITWNSHNELGAVRREMRTQYFTQWNCHMIRKITHAVIINKRLRTKS